eukprot:GHVP01015121.1.p1 GENE.GHVP01015121.1~~GHVP01015121.1.p1  ORF type:complete len:203 (+),score=39.52 GHVP01015121.1:28-609(+)
MEFLKKFSDDVSSPVVGPPIFVQNDEQESGGQNFRMVNETSSSTDTHEEEPAVIKFLTVRLKPPLAALTEAGKIITPRNHSHGEQLSFDDAIASEGTSRVQGWKVKSPGDQLWIQWCVNPTDVKENHNFSPTPKNGDERKGMGELCYVDPDSPKLKCGVCYIDANAVVFSPSGKKTKAAEVFKQFFASGFYLF